MSIKQFIFSPFQENTYVLWDEATMEAAVVDPGMMMRAEREEIAAFIDGHGLKVKYLINTHIHVDHMCGDAFITERYGVGLSASPLDAFLAARIIDQVKMFHLPIKIAETIEIQHELRDGDRLMLGAEPIDVIAVPGHSPGSVALYLPESKTVIVGDALFQGSIGRTDLPGGDYATLISSITDRLMTLPPDTRVLSGHGPATTISTESRLNPYI